MHSRLVCLGFVAMLSGFDGGFGGTAWSPDGKWIAFVTESGGASGVASAWWAHAAVRTPEPRAARPRSSQLWLCQIDSGLCWRLATAGGELSAPSWSPDGRQIAYLRWAQDGGGRARRELVLQSGFDDPKILAVQDVSADPQPSTEPRRADEVIRAARAAGPAWSSRGTYLAVPWLDPPGTAIVRVADGKLMTNYHDAYHPSWSPDERRIALVRAAEPEGYHVTLPDFGGTVPAIATRHATQAALWDASGQAFYGITWREQPVASGVMQTAELTRFELAGEKAETLRPVISVRREAGTGPFKFSFAQVPGTMRLLAAACREGQLTDVLEMDFQGRAAPRRYLILDPSLQVGALTFARDRNTMALRYGPAGALGVPALYDLLRSELRTIVPDRATQLTAAQTIARLLLHVLETAPPPNDRKRPEGLLRVPSPGELRALALRDGRVTDRIQRLAQYGMEILDAQTAAEPDGADRRALAETRMFLAYMTRDYAATLRTVDLLEPLLSSSRERLALSVVRAQCYIGQHKWSEARELLVLLGRRAGKPDPDDPDSESIERRLLRATVERLLEELAAAQT